MAKQERAERTVGRLVSAAAEEFGAKGFAKATLSDVSRVAGVTKGALFFHFSSKDELADAVHQRSRYVLEDLIDDLRERESSPMQVLIDVTHALGGLLRDDPFVRASARITREQVRWTPKPIDFYTVWLGAARDLLDQASASGEVRQDESEELVWTLVSSTFSSVEGLAWMGTPHDVAARWLSGWWEIMLPVLLVPGGLEAKLRTEPPPAKSPS